MPSATTVLNKTDRLDPEELEARLEIIKYLAPNPISVSAKKGTGIPELKAEIFRHLPSWKTCSLTLPNSPEGMSALSWLYEEGIVHNVEYGEKISVD